MLTLEQAIASYEKSAERYRKSFLHCKAHGGEFYQEEAESNKVCYEHDRQLAAWFRELQERRKQPEIIYCNDCKHKGTKNCVANAWTTIFGVTVKDDFYCGLAERRTDEQVQGL